MTVPLMCHVPMKNYFLHSKLGHTGRGVGTGMTFGAFQSFLVASQKCSPKGNVYLNISERLEDADENLRLGLKLATNKKSTFLS